MPLSSVAITGDIADQVGSDFDARRTKVYVTTNIPDGTVIDTDGNKIRLGSGSVTLNADGTFSASVWVPGTGSNPSSWQTYFHVDYPDAATRIRRTRTFGPFTVTAAGDLADLVEQQEVPPTYLSTVTAQLDTYVTQAEAARDAAVDISKIAVPDDVVSTLIKGTAGAGPLTRSALSASAVPKWQPNTVYAAGDTVQAPDGSPVKTKVARTSSGSYSTTPASPPVLGAPTTATTGGTIAAGTTYYYKATALSAIGETLASAEVSRVIAAALATPVNAAFTTATTGGTLAAGTYSYRVSATNALGETLASTATTQVIAAALAAPVLNAPTTATTGGTLAAGTYYYKITATNAVGETIGSNEVSQVTTGTTSTVGLTWGAVTGATGYKIYRATTTGGQSTSPALVASVGAVTSYTDTGTAVSAGAVPATNTTATSTNTVTVNWGAVTGATGYKVYGRVGGSELLIATVGAVTTYTDTGSVTPAGALPTANTTATNTNTVGLSWAAVTGATGYKVYRATTTGGQSTSPALLATLGAVTSYTDTGSATTAGSVPTTNTANERAFWQSVNTYAGTQAETELSASFGRVFTPRQFGAVGDGTTDDSSAVQAAVNAAAAATGVVQGVQGDRYAVGSQIDAPGGSFAVDQLHLVGLPALAGKYLLSFAVAYPSTTVPHPHTDVRITRSLFDAGHNGGGIYLSNYLRVNITDCTFIGFSTIGLNLAAASDGHECIITSCHFAEYPWPQTGTMTGTAIRVGTPDNQIVNCVIASASNGIVIDQQYTLISTTHVYGCSTWGIDLTANASRTSMSGLYVDSVAMRIVDPWHTEILGSKFLHNTADAAFKFIVLKPSTAGTYLHGFKLTSCSFHNIGAAVVESIGIDTSSGTFDAGNCVDNYVDANSFSNVNKRTTRPVVRRYVTGTSTTFNLDSMLLPGPNPVSARASFLADSAGFDPTVRVSALSRTATTVTLGASGNGIVMLSADCNGDVI